MIRYLRATPELPTLVFGFELAVGLGIARRLGLLPGRMVYREGSFLFRDIQPRALWAYRVFVNALDGVVAQSETARSDLERCGVDARKLRVIANPVLEPAGLKRASPAGAPLTVLAVGRLAHEKGFDRLIRAFALFRESSPGARLVICGEGPERQNLEQLAASLGLRQAVFMAGYVADMEAQYRQADLFVLASYFEGQPNALLEAISMEIPVLCAAGRGGILDVLKQCELEENSVPLDRFEEEFHTKARMVMNQPTAKRAHAKELLAERTRLDRVLASYAEILLERDEESRSMGGVAQSDVLLENRR